MSILSYENPAYRQPDDPPLRERKSRNRSQALQRHESLDGSLTFDSFGTHENPAVWGRAYGHILATSK